MDEAHDEAVVRVPIGCGLVVFAHVLTSDLMTAFYVSWKFSPRTLPAPGATSGAGPSRPRHAAGEHNRELVGVDVAAGEDEADALAAHLIALLHQGGEGGGAGAGAFGDIVGGAVDKADGVRDLTLGDLDDAFGALVYRGDRIGIGLAGRMPSAKVAVDRVPTGCRPQPTPASSRSHGVGSGSSMRTGETFNDLVTEAAYHRKSQFGSYTRENGGQSMRVDFSKWYTDQPGRVARKYIYSHMDGLRDFDIEVHFDIEAGVSICTFVNIFISEIDLPYEMPLWGSLSLMEDSGTRAAMAMIGRPDGQSGAVINIPSRDDVDRCLELFLQGTDLSIDVETTGGEKLVQLPIPNDQEFQSAFSSSYERVRRADDAEFEGSDALMGRLDRFMRQMSGR